MQPSFRIPTEETWPKTTDLVVLFTNKVVAVRKNHTFNLCGTIAWWWHAAEVWS